MENTNKNRDDVMRATLDHVQKVAKNIASIQFELANRAAVHDTSKFSLEEFEAFVIATPKLKSLEYGSKEYKESLKSIEPAIKHHNENNSHHPEHYKDGINGMDLLDLIEMLADWKAAMERHEPHGTFEKSFEVNIPRFKIEPQLASILKNTVERLNWNSKQKTACVQNPCSICNKPIITGTFVGTGDGNMTNGGSFAHIECYRDKEQ